MINKEAPLVVLIVMDGWGIAPDSPGNGVTRTHTPNINKFWAAYPRTTLAASGEAVGLPRGEVGNTETGHLNLGAGRIVYQELLRINMSIANGGFFKNEAFLKAIKHCIDKKSNLHLMGLIGTGGVHSSIEHLFALLRLCKENKVKNVYLHAFTDGRDSPSKAALSYIDEVEEFMRKEEIGKVVSVTGRYWAMDRDLRWDRTAKAYFALTKGVAKHTTSLQNEIKKSYEEGITDEFINPTILTENGKPITIKERDSCVFFNFRIDRPRQLTKAFLLENFERDANKEIDFDPYMEKYFKKTLAHIPSSKPFERGEKIKDLLFVTMTLYSKSMTSVSEVAYPPEPVKLPLAEILSSRNIRQLRLSESEKERFVTFYFNGQRELAYPGETRTIADSPKVATYDKAPEMSADAITENFLKAVNHGETYKFVLINFANPDMVGHTGVFEATKKAIAKVDECVGRVVKKVDQLGGVTIITADHGNAEELLKADGKIDTEHSKNPVPLILVGKQFLGKSKTLPSGILADVAPTILKLLDILQPSEMTGRPLI